MPTEVVMLCADELETADLNFLKLSQFMGLNYRVVNFRNFTANSRHLINEITDDYPCVVTSCKTLATVLQAEAGSDRLESLLFKRASYLFVYGFWPSEYADLTLRYVSDDRISSMSAFDCFNHEYQVSSDFKDIARELSGIRFSPINNAIDFSFDVALHPGDVSRIISIDKKPFFILINKQNCNVFLAACKEVIDIDTKLSQDYSMATYFSQVVPSMMFLKYVCKDMCWHSKQTFANLTVDDPLLQERYGFLSYAKLLEIMDQREFTSTIAFIPWNFKRTSKGISELFRERPDKFTICMHGCDHTEGEFGSTDHKKLNYATKIASERMRAHQKLTGVCFEKVIVFPQAIFSVEAMQILKYNDFLAAVNSSAMATSLEQDKPRISDCLDAAMMHYEGFPLFTRRQLTKIPELAFDAFVGKPLLVEAHHHDFKDGYDQIGNHIARINLLVDNVQWKALGDTLRRTNMVKTEADGSILYRIYTTEALIENDTEQMAKYMIIRYESNSVPIERVLVNGENTPYDIENNYLRFALDIEAGQSVNVKVIYEDNTLSLQENKNPADSVMVCIRRHASEFRDNYLSRNDSLLGILRRVKNMVVCPH